MVEWHDIRVLTNTGSGLELKPKDLAVLYYSTQPENEISVLTQSSYYHSCTYPPARNLPCTLTHWELLFADTM